MRTTPLPTHRARSTRLDRFIQQHKLQPNALALETGFARAAHLQIAAFGGQSHARRDADHPRCLPSHDRPLLRVTDLFDLGEG
jgi:hypothetical protein